MTYDLALELDELPPIDELLRFKVRRMTVLPSPAGGGRPFVTLAFSSRDDAWAWLCDLNNEQVPSVSIDAELDRLHVDVSGAG